MRFPWPGPDGREEVSYAPKARISDGLNGLTLPSLLIILTPRSHPGTPNGGLASLDSSSDVSGSTAAFTDGLRQLARLSWSSVHRNSSAAPAGVKTIGVNEFT